MKGLRELIPSFEQALHRCGRISNLTIDKKVNKCVCHPVKGEWVLLGVHDCLLEKTHIRPLVPTETHVRLH